MSCSHPTPTAPWTRLAPSPTGALHLGNFRTFLVNWAAARQAGWQILLRIEDLDGPRVKADSALALIETLEWLGIDWDRGPVFQSADREPYDRALRDLAERGRIYPCQCTRAEIHAASLSAPHADEHELRYPGTCRPEKDQPHAWDEQAMRHAGWRLRVAAGIRTVCDQFRGTRTYDVSAQCGDFLVATKGGQPSYQLAVVTDDHRQGVTHIVRGDDLLPSAARQACVREALAIEETPLYWHLPLVRGPDGKRLAKRHGDSRVATYRAKRTPRERLIGLMASWSGIAPRFDPQAMTIAEFCERFTWQNLPATDIVFHPLDDAWLTSGETSGRSPAGGSSQARS